MSDFGVGLLLVVSVASAGIGAGRRVLERRRARRELRTRPTLVASSREGTLVRVTGVVRVHEDELVAPLSGTSCVVFRSRVTAGKGVTRRAARPRETFAMVAFVLDRGGDGSVAIEGEHALLDLPPLALPPLRGQASEARTRREQFARSHEVRPREIGRAVFEETVVVAGMTVSIAGLMMKDPAEAPPATELGFRDPPAPALRVAGDAAHPIVIGLPVDPPQRAMPSDEPA